MNTEEIFLLCSSCFNDQGLKLDAERIGVEDPSECINCHLTSGRKLNRAKLQNLTYRFFVLGSMHRTDFGGAPILQFNYSNTNGIKAAPWFELDLLLLQKVIDARIFHYGPRLWIIGTITPLERLKDRTTRKNIVDRVLKEYPTKELIPGDIFYRIRKAPQVPSDISEYDSPPEKFRRPGRIDSDDFPVMYASSDLELCIHECRVTAEDEIYVATLSAERPLKLLNLAHLLAEPGVNEFESLDLAMNMLFLAGKHSYDIIRDLAQEAFSAGFDGLNYPSYFSLLRTGKIPFETQFGFSNRWMATRANVEGLAEYELSKSIPNIALFGRPIEQGLVRVKCINRLILSRISYDAHFGPVGYS